MVNWRLTRFVSQEKNAVDEDDQGGASALDRIIRQMEQTFGKGALMKLGDCVQRISQEDVISSGSLALDMALGIGGYPRGRIVEIYGPESSGKTTLALHCIANAQETGGQCVFVDAEHALDVNWANRLGVNMDSLLVAQPDSGEQALEIIDTLVQTNQIDVIVLDSVAALVPKVELDGEMGALQIGAQARLMSQAMRKLVPSLSKTRTLLIFLNQIRMKVGVLFGNPETTPGGNALKYYASVRLDIRRTGSITKGDVVTANQTRVKVSKNKLAPPFRLAEFDIDFSNGISRIGEIVDLGVKNGIILKSGSWYTLADGNKQLGQGRDKVKAYLTENPHIARDIENMIRKKVISTSTEVTPNAFLPDDASPPKLFEDSEED